jgi:predicted nucleic acid-binding protein
MPASNGGADGTSNARRVARTLLGELRERHDGEVLRGGPIPPGVEDAVDAARSGACLLMVPPLFASEVVHAVLRHERAGRLSAAEVDAVLAVLDRLPVRVDQTPPSAAALAELSRQSGLSAYDATYAELARRVGGELMTADVRLAAGWRK